MTVGLKDTGTEGAEIREGKRATDLTFLIEQYFGDTVILPRNYKLNESHGEIAQIENVKGSAHSGYVFVGPCPDDDDRIYEKRLQWLLRVYQENFGAEITRKFVDYSRRVAGFAWKAGVKCDG
jgi:hypothetical protein